MPKPFIHSQLSVKKYGGAWEDYQDIHDFMDSSKSTIADVRHRVIFHSAFGIFIVEKVFGAVRVNSDGRNYSVRDVAEDHVIQDLGFIPTLEQYLINTPMEGWMSGDRKKDNIKIVSRQLIKLVD